MDAKKHIALITTGGTIEKTYDEYSGMLSNQLSILDWMLTRMTLNGVDVTRIPLMNKDSLDLTDEDFERIAVSCEQESRDHDGVVVVHGTDRMPKSGQRTYDHLNPTQLTVPIVFTGAMRPWELRRSDALQNFTEAMLAVQILAPGVYIVMHNQVLAFPGICKNYEEMTFEHK